MKITRASLDDLELLTPLFDGYMVFYEQPSDPERHRRFLVDRLSREEAFVFIATDETGAGMGFTLLYPSFSSVSMARIYVLNDLYVHPDHRQKGVASRLMAAAADFGRSKGAIRLHLETGHDNTRAQALYEKEGWVKDSSYHYSLTL